MGMYVSWNDSLQFSYILTKPKYRRDVRWLDISVLLHMYMSIAKEKKTAAVAM